MRTMLIALMTASVAIPAHAQMGQRAPVVRSGGWTGGTSVNTNTNTNVNRNWNGGGWTGGTVRNGGGWTGGNWNRNTNVNINNNNNNNGGWTGGSWSGGHAGNWNQNNNWNGNGHWTGTRPQPNGGNPGTWSPPRDHGRPGHDWNGGNRWGGTIGGRWYAGSRAPGGWNAYRRPQRGWVMPGYWQSPNWAINDWQFYGLQAPPAGYGWSRYYDDAVLLDGNGYVYDSVGGVDWQRTDQPYPTGYDYPSQGYINAPAGSYNGYDERCYRRSKGSGIGGALVGGAIGAGIGAATGGLGSTLIGGGVGALAGQAIDRESRGSQVVCDGYPSDGGYAYDQGYPQGGYPQGGQGGYAYADNGYAYAQGGQGGVAYAPPQPVIQPIYGYQNWGYAPGVTATATVEFGAPITTTTTTTTVTEEWVSDRRVVRRPAKRTRSKIVCRC